VTLLKTVCLSIIPVYMTRLKKILVVLPQPLGDAVLATPALRLLRHELSDWHITCLGNPVTRAVLQGHPACTHWLTIEARGGKFPLREIHRERFDAAVLLVNSFRAAWLTWMAGIPRRFGYIRDGRRFLLTDGYWTPTLPGRRFPFSMVDYYRHLVATTVHRLTGRTVQPESEYPPLELFTSPTECREIDRLLSDWCLDDPSRLVLLVPGGAFGPSKWWPAEYFAQLADRLHHDGYHVAVSCAPSEHDIAREIRRHARSPVLDLSGENLGLGGLKELIRRCSLVIANDTGPCHIAAAFGTPLVTLSAKVLPPATPLSPYPLR